MDEKLKKANERIKELEKELEKEKELDSTKCKICGGEGSLECSNCKLFICKKCWCDGKWNSYMECCGLQK